eukprot:g8136.t1
MERKIEFRNKQGEKLVGKLMEAPLGKTVVLCHGYSSHKDTRVLKTLAEELQKTTLSSLRFDFSGNGESEGVFEFGNYLKEVEDIRSAVEFLRDHHGKEIIGLVGHSKAATDVLLYGSIYDDVPFVVSLASRFDMSRGIHQRFGDEILKKLDQMGEVEVPRVTPEGKVATYMLTKKSLNERLNTNMEEAAAKIKNSKVLTVHGTSDAVIPFEDAESIDKLVEKHELYLIENADHNFSQDSHLEALTKRVLQFLEPAKSSE